MSDDEKARAGKLKVVFAWHMHQPHYVDMSAGHYALPWTYLHAMKDYVDMAAHLEATDGARAVVNFAPTLLEQIDDYSEQIEAWMLTGRAIQDDLLNSLVSPILPSEPEQRAALVRSALRVNRERVVDRFPAFKRLAEVADHFADKPQDMHFLSDLFIVDLVVWYHLGWVAETVRREDDRVKELMAKATNFTLADRRLLMMIVQDLLSSIIRRYRDLAKVGKVELSVTPYAHPIGPLMLDLQSAREAWPECELPELDDYPGGEQRLRWHIEHGIEVFEQFFGILPEGCWPAEGGVSQSVWALLGEYGFRWIATGEAVLSNTLSKAGRRDLQDNRGWVHQPYVIKDGDIRCFFRDDGLSDLIGFEYSSWHGDDAVGDLIQNLENIAEESGSDPCTVVSIILDGENAWEYYPENAYYFLSALYARLDEHEAIEMVTFTECTELKAEVAPPLVAGSWVYGTFSTWIGSKDKNRGWDMLGDAKKAFDLALEGGKLADDERLRMAQRQLAICEGSDWFWWFGDDNPGESVSDFERLFRLHLNNLYGLIGTEVPAYLSRSFTHGGTEWVATGGVMRPGQS